MSSGGKKQDDASRSKSKKERTSPMHSTGISLWVRVFASVLLTWHVFLMFLSPMANTNKTSFTIQDVAFSRYVRWYSDPLFLNQGYGFFGPDPTPSFLIDYTVFDDQNAVIDEGRFPDVERTWPRLRYHRFKMLADQVPVETDPQSVQDLSNSDVDPLKCYARYLIRQHDGQRAVITLTSHELVTHGDWLGSVEELPSTQRTESDTRRNRKSLTDKSTYRLVRTVQQTRADVERIEQARSKQTPKTPESRGPTQEAIPLGRPQ